MAIRFEDAQDVKKINVLFRKKTFTRLNCSALSDVGFLSNVAMGTTLM